MLARRYRRHRSGPGHCGSGSPVARLARRRCCPLLRRSDHEAGAVPRPQLAAGPADLDTLLKPVSAHLIVNGDEVFSELPTEDPMDKLIHGLAALAARTDAEVTILFDGQSSSGRGLHTSFRAVPGARRSGS